VTILRPGDKHSFVQARPHFTEKRGAAAIKSQTIEKRSPMSIGLILLIVLILLVLGALPTWGHSRSWGYGPSGGVGLLLLIVVVLVVMGRI
jgi:cytochrome c-type biogenesis protein CcmH/NrfG